MNLFDFPNDDDAEPDAYGPDHNAVTVREAFAAFHAANPHVYELFKKFAFEARNRGRGKYSARTIVERIRWHVDVDIEPRTGADEFKVNNNYCALYARLMIHDHPEMAEFFELRKMKV